MNHVPIGLEEEKISRAMPCCLFQSCHEGLKVGKLTTIIAQTFLYPFTVLALTMPTLASNTRQGDWNQCEHQHGKIDHGVFIEWA